MHEAGDDVDSFTKDNDFGQEAGQSTMKNMQRRLSMTMGGGKSFKEDAANQGGTTKQGEMLSTVGGVT